MILGSVAMLLIAAAGLAWALGRDAEARRLGAIGVVLSIVAQLATEHFLRLYAWTRLHVTEIVLGVLGVATALALLRLAVRGGSGADDQPTSQKRRVRKGP